jgi:hypothetical protein
VLTKAFFEPLPEQELRLWNGQDEPKKDEPKKVRRRARK